MANNISEKLAESWKKLPNAINGNGQNFIFLLKTLLGDLKDELDDKFEEISNIANSVTDAPEEMDEQLQNCKIQEVRVGTNISLVLTWDHSNVKNYDSAEIYIKETKGNIADHKNWDEVEVSRTIRTAKADTVQVDGINAGYIYQITFQAKNTFGSVSRKSGCPVLQYEVSSMNNSPDPPLEFNVYFNKDGVLWTWKQPVNLDSSYSELRTNTDVGDKEGLLEVTQDTKSTVLPPAREGTAYLYNKGYGSKYSTPLTKPWSKPVPLAPQTITAVSTYQGLQFTYSQIPEDCQGICISINGKKHYTKDDKFNYYCSTGSYAYKACFYDCFGEGVWTAEKTIATLEEIPPDAVHVTKQTVFDDGVIVGKYIGDHEVVGTKIKEGTITTENLAAGCVTANELASNSVTTDKIEAGAIKSDKIAAGAVTADSIGANAVTADKLTSGAVTADKLAANTINLAGALKVVGGNVTLDENGLSVSQNNGTCTKFNKSGMIFVDSKGNSFSGIGRFCTGTADDGQMVRFDNPWDIIPVVFTFPVSLQTSITGYTNADLYQYIRAENVSASGFRVACRTILKSGSNGYQLVNSLINPGQFDIPKGGITKTITWSTNIPNTASVFYIDGSLVAHGYDEKPRSLQISGAGSQTIDGKAYEVWGDLEILSDNQSIFKQSNYSYYSYESGGSYSATSLPTGLSVAGKSNIKFVATLRYIYYQVDYDRRRKHTFNSPSGDTAIASYSGLKINSYSFNTTSDQIICRGTAGFIAVDPNTVPYSVS